VNIRYSFFMLLLAPLLACSEQAPPSSLDAQVLGAYPAEDAFQAVAVDADHFYAINNFRIGRYEKVSGEFQESWDGVSDKTGSIIHLDSAMVYEGLLYAAHSNFPQWPMASSIEIWDTRSMQHLRSHAFPEPLGSMTWLDRHDGYWWGGFGNYDRIIPPRLQAYGKTENTLVVKMDDEFNILEQWRLPEELLPRLRPMSNSGGSWGGDGYLYLTGHDHPEIYVMTIPEAGQTLRWETTVIVEGFDGQGIAWDRDEATSILWGISRGDAEVWKLGMPSISLP
tara:strand:- start:10685 stop:11527 length:843 start_codon:yes stop_codon:yes gene_type:complete